MITTPQALPILAHLVRFTGAMRLGIGVHIATLEHPRFAGAPSAA
jgi:hypothetical protein